MKFAFQLLLVILFCLPNSVLAQLPQQLREDFAPLGGTVIMPIGEEYLIDLDASANLSEGDILTLVASGEKVIHPVTKEVLGSLDIPRGYLQVTRIKSGYSYARLLISEETPAKGDQLRRYEQVPTMFIDKEGDGEALYADLQKELPHLDWLSQKSETQPFLTFTLENKLLKATAANDIQLHTYAMVDGQPVAPATPVTQMPAELKTSEPKILEKAVKGIIGTLTGHTGSDVPTDAIIEQNGRSGIWMSHSLEGHPVGLAVADLDADGQQEIALAMSDSLQIGRIEDGKYKPVAEVEIPVRLNLLSLDAIDLDGNQNIELYVTAEREDELQSFVVDYINGRYTIVIDNIDWFLRKVELPDRGEVLLGQQSNDPIRHFSGQPFEVLRDGQRLLAAESYNLPEQINIYSFLPFRNEDGQLLYAYLSPTDYLKVANLEGTILWESGDYFGGSETYLDPAKNINQNELPPRIYIGSPLLKGPTGKEILVAQNDGLRTLQRFRMFKKSRLLAMRWNGHALDELWRTAQQNGYLADFTLADADNDGKKEIVQVVKFKHKGILQKNRSAIVTYELN